MTKKYDYVSVISTVVLLISLLLPDFIHFKETRISLAEPISAKECLGTFYVWVIVLSGILLMITFIKKKSLWGNFLCGVYTALLLAILVMLVSVTSASMREGGGRISFGVGFIIAVISLYSIILKCEQFAKRRWMKSVIGVLAWVLIGILLVAGLLDNYSVLQEYQAQKAQFFTNVAAHMRLSFSALLVAVTIGLPTGYLCYRNSKTDKAVIAVLSITETMPQLALFAIIRVPFIFLSNQFPVLKEMGFGGYGFAPAFAALFLYALYLVIHNVRAAFCNIDPRLIENAFAMGMTASDVFWKVQMPSAMPYILNGIRIALISTIVGASLSSFVGAAGLGVYIVNGINALAIDLQLLGIIPIFIITVVADLLMGILIKALIPRGGATID